LDGFQFAFDANGNTLTQNVGLGNRSADLEGDGGFELEDDPSCDNNAWRFNAGTRNQICIP
jgi:hypothetical protein